MNKLSFKELIEKYSVVVPMLQRDYAYGRDDEKEKRENFLKNLKTYFANSTPHELDFVYGSIDEKSNLKLLDGQQRITTLFLLHWYLSLVNDNSKNNHFEEFKQMMLSNDGESKFSYKTRFSSTDFCNALVSLSSNGIDYATKYTKIVEDPNACLSDIIKKEKWFLPHWKYDPTIISMLNMIDSIKKFFKPEECRNYYDKLVNCGQLAFNFLNLDDFKLTDELYIKMNSRGRTLTRFENLKSKILKLYDQASKEVSVKYTDKLNKINSITAPNSYNSLREYVSYMFDTKWTDVFWNEWLNNSEHAKEPNVDDMMLSFITSMAIYDHIIFKLNGRLSLGRKDKLTKEINDLMSEKDKNKGITIRYDKLVDLFIENDYALLFNIIDYFNIFNDNGKLKQYLPASFKYFSERESFKYLVNDYKYGMEYERKAKLFAYIKYLFLNPTPNIDHLQSWMRFVCNVCSNSYNLANYTDTFCTSIAGLNYLYAEDIQKDGPGKNLTDLTTLDIPQIEEEFLKMKLSTDSKWNDVLFDAESQLEYFEGHLRYPLIDCCKIEQGDVSNIEKINVFKEYVKKISSIFPNSNGCSCEKELIRAMLSKGNYLMYFSSNNTLLKNADRDNSWKRFLKEKPDGNNAYHPFETNISDKRDFFKQVIDDDSFDIYNVKKSLDNIANSRASDIPMWRRLIIDCKEILDNRDVVALGSDRFIRWNKDAISHKKDTEENYEIDLIPGSAITGYHAELFSLAKYYELKEKTFKTFGELKYQRTKTNIEQPYIYLGEDENPIVKVMYQDDDCFKIVLSDGTEKNDVSYSDVENEIMSMLP